MLVNVTLRNEWKNDNVQVKIRTGVIIISMHDRVGIISEINARFTNKRL